MLNAPTPETQVAEVAEIVERKAIKVSEPSRTSVDVSRETTPISAAKSKQSWWRGRRRARRRSHVFGICYGPK
jgi:hypothetical protein